MRSSFEQPQTVATSLIDPFCSGGRRAVSPRRSLFRQSEQATSQNLGSPAASTSISFRGITPQRLYPNYYMSQLYTGVHTEEMHERQYLFCPRSLHTPWARVLQDILAEHGLALGPPHDPTNIHPDCE